MTPTATPAPPPARAARGATYDKHPFVAAGDAHECAVGWDAVGARLRAALAGRARCRVAVECYPGVDVAEVARALAGALAPALVCDVGACLRPADAVDRLLAPALGDDPVFGRMTGVEVADYLDPARVAAARAAVDAAGDGVALVVGTGAALIAPDADLVVYADLARWEIQQRQRRGEVGNLGAGNAGERPSLLYKRAYFADWRAADRLKRRVLPAADFLLDTNNRAVPKLVAGDAFRRGLAEAVRRPFRVVPFFDPGPWGGQWMRRVCDLPDGPPNYAWCFDCVPEENSLLLGFGPARVEVPALDLVYAHPRELLGDPVHARFGAEFPIRFDFLDTVGGGNLSLQVHPLTEYIQDRFGLAYTQDESYYLLDAEPGACVYLGLREDADLDAMAADLRRAQADPAFRFPDERYAHRRPARKHDHFLIPAGTLHCSGAGGMVLEISATPYIFTFKLWDWGRLGLDGRPRPVHLDHGLANLQRDRRAGWAERELVNRVEPLGAGDGWREERTGLHPREFIETRRHWFDGAAPHHTGGAARGGVHVLNLVEGAEAVVESPDGAFAPFVVHYAETFIVPAAVGAYTVRPHGPAAGRECATVKAFVRTGL